MDTNLFLLKYRIVEKLKLLKLTFQLLLNLKKTTMSKYSKSKLGYYDFFHFYYENGEWEVKSTDYESNIRVISVITISVNLHLFWHWRLSRYSITRVLQNHVLKRYCVGAQGGNSQNFLRKFLIFFVTLGFQILWLQWV